MERRRKLSSLFNRKYIPSEVNRLQHLATFSCRHPVDAPPPPVHNSAYDRVPAQVVLDDWNEGKPCPRCNDYDWTPRER